VTTQADGSLFPNLPSVAVEYHGQIVSPCAVIRKAGPFLRVVLPVAGERNRVRWIPKWRVIAGQGSVLPLDTEAVLWVAALDRVPIEERIEWVAEMKRRVGEINAERTTVAV
jgi:hypothetical protein